MIRNLTLTKLSPDIKQENFQLLGVWSTEDGRLAVVDEINEDSSIMSGIVTRAGRTYRCQWNPKLDSITPFKHIDNLYIKLE